MDNSRYKYGITIDNMNLEEFEVYCKRSNITKELEKGLDGESCVSASEYYQEYLESCVRIWSENLSKQYAIPGMEIMFRIFGIEETIACIVKTLWDKKEKIATKISLLPRINLKGKTIKTIAIYYYHYTIGGIQRVISILAPRLINMGYKVVIVTDTDILSNEFLLPAGVTRVSIFNRENVNADNYGERLNSWLQLIVNYKIDLLLYNAWTSKLLLWDMLYLKSKEIPVIVHAHSVFSYSVNKLYSGFYELTKILALADGIVVLSDVDKVFWEAFNDNVHHIPNPLSSELMETTKGRWENKSLIWVGRVSNEKQPEAVFEIMEKVTSKVPDIKLYLIGDFTEKKWRDMAEKKGISANIEFCGEITNVNDYYEKASICISTSKFEGFSMVLAEAQAHGLPTVMFRMPNLTLGKKECGVCGVEMHDYNGAAEEIVKLIHNETYWHKMSQLAEKSYIRLKEYNFDKAWSRVLLGEQNLTYISEPVKDMIHTFVEHYNEGLRYKKKQDKKRQDKSKTDKTEKKNQSKYLFLIKKLRGFFRCCIDHDILYTIKYCIGKIIN